jgi:hypothetical protein
MRVVEVLLGIAVLSMSSGALRAEASTPACPAEKRITTEGAAIDVAKQYFTKHQKLIRRIGGKAIDAIARNLSGDCCEVIRDDKGNWHVDLMDKRDNPRTVFAYAFDECGNAVETRHAKEAAGKK